MIGLVCPDVRPFCNRKISGYPSIQKVFVFVSQFGLLPKNQEHENDLLISRRVRRLSFDPISLVYVDVLAVALVL